MMPSFKKLKHLAILRKPITRPESVIQSSQQERSPPGSSIVALSREPDIRHVHASNPSTEEVEARLLGVQGFPLLYRMQGQPGLHETPAFKMVVYYHSSLLRKEGEEK